MHAPEAAISMVTIKSAASSPSIIIAKQCRRKGTETVAGAACYGAAGVKFRELVPPNKKSIGNHRSPKLARAAWPVEMLYMPEASTYNMLAALYGSQMACGMSEMSGAVLVTARLAFLSVCCIDRSCPEVR